MMERQWICKAICILLLSLTKVQSDYARVTLSDLMKCSYGERGSLTATCVNATPSFFKTTLYKFDHLDETLRCVNCTLTSIESNTFDLSGNQIKNLDLRNSLIESLKPKAFMGLIFLENLDLSDNKIRSIFPGTFNGTKKITTINLSRNEISILSEDGFAELINLQKLILRENSIKMVDPRAFNGLVSLKGIDLSYNQIETLKNVFENLTSLEIIDLSNNFVVVLSGEEFTNLKKLNEINLSKNKINDPPIRMDPDNQLRKINFAYNNIEFLWSQFTNLNALEELNLSHNKLTSITKACFDNLINLHDLDLSYNKLLEFRTGSFSGLPQLRGLNCSHNLIREVLITGVFSLHSLHTLDLSYNNLSDLDYTALIARIPALTYLRLEDNQLPCDLENEMKTEFSEDNFKYVLYDNVVGVSKCVRKPLIKKSYARLHDSYVEKKTERASSVDIWLFVLLSLAMIAIAILFYLQYLFYNGIQVGARRVASNVQLIASEEDVSNVNS